MLQRDNADIPSVNSEDVEPEKLLPRILVQ